MANQDLYAVLGVPRTAQPDEIKKAYRDLAKKHHPDRNPGDKAAEERFKEISAAWAVLSDEDKRKRYDEFGINGLREGFDPEAARNYERWASQAGRGGGQRVRVNPADFQDVFSSMGGGGGASFGGFGDLDDLLGSLFGGGRRRAQQAPRRGQDIEADVVVSVRDAVEGTQVLVPDFGVRVRIPAGVTPGQRIRVPGKGGEAAGGSGDLYLRVHVAAPPGFHVLQETDLEVDLPLTVGQAMNGTTVTVPTPEGSTVQLKVPARTQSGQRLRLRGKGMPGKGGRGDLYARALIRLPETDDPRAGELAEQLDNYY